jgi:hypothetical protein
MSTPLEIPYDNCILRDTKFLTCNFLTGLTPHQIFDVNKHGGSTIKHIFLKNTK